MVVDVLLIGVIGNILHKTLYKRLKACSYQGMHKSMTAKDGGHLKSEVRVYHCPWGLDKEVSEYKLVQLCTNHHTSV